MPAQKWVFCDAWDDCVGNGRRYEVLSYDVIWSILVRLARGAWLSSGRLEKCIKCVKSEREKRLRLYEAVWMIMDTGGGH